MKKLLSLILLVSIAEFSFSQTDYRNGYVITNVYDTLFGLVDYREKTKAHKSCNFKVSKDQNVVSYEPGSIFGYGFKNDRFFQSKEISIKNQASQIVFLEVIVKGLVSLYKFEDTYFVEKNNDGIQQLKNETKEVLIYDSKYSKKTNQHISTLNMLLYDCVEIKTEVQKVKLGERLLGTLIENYNRCKGQSSTTFKAKKPWSKAIIGLTGGLNFSQLKFDANSGYEHLAGDLEISKSPVIGLSLDILSPRLSERISFHGDLLYSNSKYYNYTLYSSSSAVERNYVTIELQQLKVPIGIRYTFPEREFIPYFNAGIVSTIHLSSNSKWVQEIESNSIVKTRENEALVIKNKQFGLWGGLGVLKSVNNKFDAFLELRYEQTNGIAPFSVDLQGVNSITNFKILIGIRTK
jgi:Outer membrane protein beta-barrel domain